jgi:carotenoid cleavage dioxygenase-like enzyme
MKALMVLVLLAFLVSVGDAQAVATRTESASNKWYNTATAVALDTIFERSASTGTGGYLVGVAWNTNVASDTLILYDGTRAIATTILPATAPAPFFQEFYCKVDSLLTYKKVKTSNITVIYRTNY